jgi:glutamate/tyrosine decarboxylase-like PLP-dependent enzyme
MIEQSCALARITGMRILSEPQLELLAPVELNIVCFRYRAHDVVNAEIVVDLHESGRVAPSTTTIDGKLAIRACFINHRTQPEDVDLLIDSVLSLGREKTARAAA